MNPLRGLKNLAYVLFASWCLGRGFIKYIIKYGIMVDPVLAIHILFPYCGRELLVLLLILNLFIVVSWMVQKAVEKNLISRRTAMVLAVINLVSMLAVPAIFTVPHALYGGMMACLYVCVFLKLMSFHQVCHLGYHTGSETSLRVIYQFMVFPTLCFDTVFGPRSSSIRISYVFLKMLEVFFLACFMMVIVQQWIVPIVVLSRPAFRAWDVLAMLEAIFTLALPNNMLWLTWFLLTFKAGMSCTAELMRFSGRVFYMDWWNSESVAVFWRKWNLPVHTWAIRHVYKPLLQCGYTKTWARLAVFLISALLHEYVVSIPLRMFGVHSFAGMMMQIPLAMLSLPEPLGNILMWASLVFGQPMGILMYTADFFRY